MRVSVVVVIALLLAGCGEEKPEPAEPWVAEPVGTRAGFRDVFFLDARRGWIVGGGINIRGGIVGSTLDGGRTWSFRSGIVQPSPRATSFHLNAVWFLDQRTGIIVGDGFHILRTVDGGEHWHKVAMASRVWAHLYDVHFVDANWGWAVGNGELVRTTDGGATWGRPRAADPQDDDLDRTRGQALYFADSNRGWVVGKSGLIRMTTDGGATWTEMGGPQASEKPDLWGLDFADHRHGWAVGEGGAILHTADGGQNWQPQISGVRDTLMDVDFVDRLHGWAVGFERTAGSAAVLSTTDGGTTWTEQARVASEAMRALFALDHEHAWAVGEQQRRSPEDGSQKLLRYVGDQPVR